MPESRKTLIIVIAAVAALLAVYSGWRAFHSTQPLSEKERMNTTSGPISRMSSILGPDPSGRPRTNLPVESQPASAQASGGK